MYKKGSFYLFKKKKYYIYGYTERAVLIAKLLKKNKYNFCGYIDKNAEKLRKEYQIDVNTIEEQWIDKRSIIYISCYSIDTQHKIAEMLSELGYNNLIFMAAGADFLDQYATVIRRAWEAYDCEQIPSEFKLPKYRKAYANSDIIESRGKQIVAWIPIEMLYSNIKRRDRYDSKVWENLKEELDIPLVSVDIETQFFEYIINHKGTCDQYLDVYSKMYGIDAKSKLKERRKILQVWDQELARGVGYFCDAAVKGTWNSTGYFNVLDGTHRCFYMLYRGFSMIPMLISKEDYAKYYNEKNIKDKKLELHELALPHPSMFRNMLEHKDRSFLWVRIIQFFWKKIKMYHSFLDLEDKDGYWALAFKRCGVEKITCYKMKNATNLENVMKLLYAENIEVTNDLTRAELENNYDIIWCTDKSITFDSLTRLVEQGKTVIYDCAEKRDTILKIVQDESPFFCYTDLYGNMRTIYVFDRG